MKHLYEEYVAWVDGMIEQIENESPALDPVADWRMIEILKASIASLLANLATLERHKPKPLMGGSLLPKFQCDDGCGNFPCYSYTDVTDQLDLVMGVSND